MSKPVIISEGLTKTAALAILVMIGIAMLFIGACMAPPKVEKVMVVDQYGRPVQWPEEWRLP